MAGEATSIDVAKKDAGESHAGELPAETGTQGD